jgi:epoxyqueuosine reductase
MKPNLRSLIVEQAEGLGFDLVGVAAAGQAPHADGFRAWIDQGYAGEMTWLARNQQRRLEPAQVVPGARSVVMVGLRYFVEDPPAALWNDPLRGRVARYAWGPDYHDQLLPRLMQLANFLKAEGGACRAYVDTGPLLERSWAAQAGLGFIGKNSLLINPELGSYLFLGGLITDLVLEPDEPATADGAMLGKGQCGACQRCLQVCPTHAFPAPYILDSRRCISYLTIELKGAIPEPLRDKMGSWIYGCDACQECCPWVRRFSASRPDRFLAFDAERFAPDLMELMTLDAAAFRERYRRTPLVRTKRRGLLRNAAVALGNAGEREALPVLRRALDDPEALIREHAAWAIARIEAG